MQLSARRYFLYPQYLKRYLVLVVKGDSCTCKEGMVIKMEKKENTDYDNSILDATLQNSAISTETSAGLSGTGCDGLLDKTKKHQDCFMRDTCLQTDVCPMVLVQKILSGKRKILILWFLSNKVLRFNEIKRKMPDVTQKMLTTQLRSLEEDHLISQHVYPTVPPKVEYELTSLGRQIIPILEMMHHFGAIYLDHYTKEDWGLDAKMSDGEICS